MGGAKESPIEEALSWALCANNPIQENSLISGQESELFPSLYLFNSFYIQPIRPPTHIV